MLERAKEKKKMSQVNCPLCDTNSVFRYKLPKDETIEHLQLYYNKKLSEGLIKKMKIVDYSLYNCPNCQLQFAEPMVMGSEAFYSWITTQKSYFHAERWEWLIIANLIKHSAHKKKVTLLEIGCGSGIFLEKLRDIKNLTAIGIDPTPEATQICQNNGLKVYTESLDSFLGQKNRLPKKFDYVVAFHTLEHMNNPKDWINKMIKLLKTEGEIIVSTPYSPLSVETMWHDPLNHPPHHMSRWNLSAYKELGRQVGLKVSLKTSPASSTIVRSLISLNLSWNTPAKLKPLWKVGLRAATKLNILIAELERQRLRETVNRSAAGDIALVRLRKQNKPTKSPSSGDNG